MAKKRKKKSYNYNSPAYKGWRLNVFRRDKYQCQLCGKLGQINAHHIKRKIDFPELTYRLDNGITLCVTCHNAITGKEKMVEMLFGKIVRRKLAIRDIVKVYAVAKEDSLLLYGYFNKHKEIITNMLVKLIKRQEILR